MLHTIEIILTLLFLAALASGAALRRRALRDSWTSWGAGEAEAPDCLQLQSADPRALARLLRRR